MNIFSRLYSAIRFALTRSDSLPWQSKKPVEYDECPCCRKPARGRRQYHLITDENGTFARQVSVLCEHCGATMEVLRAARKTC